jgi:hypothetical protein
MIDIIFIISSFLYKRKEINVKIQQLHAEKLEKYVDLNVK